MDQNKLSFHPVPAGADAGMGRMVIASLVLHALVVALFSGLFVPSVRKNDRPVYYVDLVNLPVERPQAGRPDGRKTETVKSEKAEPKTVKKEKPAAAKTPETVQVAAPKPPPAKVKAPEVKAPAKKKEPKKKASPKAPPKTKPKSVEESYQSTLSAVEAMRAKKQVEQEKNSMREKREALKNKLAALTAQDTRSTGSSSDAPLGMPDGTGDEIGPSVEASLQSFFKSNWSLSKYQVARQDLETEIRVVYDIEGNLIKKSITRHSGDKVFDQSVEDAVLKSKKLPFPLPKKLDDTVIFNLRDLQQ